MPDTPAPGPVAFRQLMGQFATGVAVVTVQDAGGAVAAMTINSLVSVSLDPMLVSWSLKNGASQFAAYAGAERFSISILAESQQAIARRYAARGSSALIAEDFADGAGCLPVIAGALGHLACRRFALHEAGDHTLILGQVEALVQGSEGSRPLVFFGGKFGGLEHHN